MPAMSIPIIAARAALNVNCTTQFHARRLVLGSFSGHEEDQKNGKQEEKIPDAFLLDPDHGSSGEEFNGTKR
jgi:hypothetical protein